MTQVSSPIDPLVFKAPFGLSHRHTQSMLAGWSGRGRLLRLQARAFIGTGIPQIVHCSDGTRLLAVRNDVGAESRGLVVVLHGWEGCVDSNYMISVSQSLSRAGYDVLRLNFRDHGGTQALNEELFHSCRIAEVVDAVFTLQSLWPDKPLHVVGFSLGGNFALRLAARAYHAGIRLRRVVAVCPVLRPLHTMQALEEGFWVYRRYFLHRWRRSLQAKAAAFPDLYRFGDLRRFATLTETTDFFVRNYTEFPDLNAYLEGYSIVGDALQDLHVDSVLIATRDDPVIPFADIGELARSEALRIFALDSGGHCGMLDTYGLRSWADKAIVHMLNS